MIIIGVDFHPEFQQIAFVDTNTQFDSGQLRIEKQARVNLGLNGPCGTYAEQIRHTLACNPK